MPAWTKKYKKTRSIPTQINKPQQKKAKREP